ARGRQALAAFAQKVSGCGDRLKKSRQGKVLVGRVDPRPRGRESHEYGGGGPPILERGHDGKRGAPAGGSGGVAEPGGGGPGGRGRVAPIHEGRASGGGGANYPGHGTRCHAGDMPAEEGLDLGRVLVGDQPEAELRGGGGGDDRLAAGSLVAAGQAVDRERGP